MELFANKKLLIVAASLCLAVLCALVVGFWLNTQSGFTLSLYDMFTFLLNQIPTT